MWNRMQSKSLKEESTLEFVVDKDSESAETTSSERSCVIRDGSTIILEDVSERESEFITLVCISDTHAKHRRIAHVPAGDILIHAGDFTDTGEEHQIADFIDWLHTLPHSFKIIIAGNHDVTIHESYYEREGRDRFHGLRGGGYDPKKCRAHLSRFDDIIYLEDSTLILEIPSKTDIGFVHRIKVHGSPWQPTFCDWAFNLPRGPTILEKWKLIPSDTDILITHGPPIGYGDRCFDGFRAGCSDLRTEIDNRIRPRLHVFGHIHEDIGVWTSNRRKSDDAETEISSSLTDTMFVNASTCTFNYRATNPPIIITYPLDRTKNVYRGRANKEK